MIPVREGGVDVLHGADGRSYKINYALGARRPWYINDRTDWEERFQTRDDAIAGAHEIEARALGEEGW